MYVGYWASSNRSSQRFVLTCIGTSKASIHAWEYQRVLKLGNCSAAAAGNHSFSSAKHVRSDTGVEHHRGPGQSMAIASVLAFSSIPVVFRTTVLTMNCHRLVGFARLVTSAAPCTDIGICDRGPRIGTKFFLSQYFSYLIAPSTRFDA